MGEGVPVFSEKSGWGRRGEFNAWYREQAGRCRDVVRAAVARPEWSFVDIATWARRSGRISQLSISDIAAIAERAERYADVRWLMKATAPLSRIGRTAVVDSVPLEVLDAFLGRDGLTYRDLAWVALGSRVRPTVEALRRLLGRALEGDSFEVREAARIHVHAWRVGLRSEVDEAIAAVHEPTFLREVAKAAPASRAIVRHLLRQGSLLDDPELRPLMRHLTQMDESTSFGSPWSWAPRPLSTLPPRSVAPSELRSALAATPRDVDADLFWRSLGRVPEVRLAQAVRTASAAARLTSRARALRADPAV